ncbi:carbohydrate ABC transporter membrane protein 1, CUT1 family [Microlunatus sagamiharensis]|uniref:Carbohydrate ABC transporter membrane protein 1, CUT1 family n=1 Tax=Microlunatus sagamiharensis TaxID=546874 RepID=A0A1H2ME83_9ACTN|nr:sugar ABC transporter permease [Microlunatus sagamiharensis]SDU91442.1 carbohydrate ABC transporter membrane protein 1, CUT1 family [Microlunatus sagamiharensis]
MTTVTQTPPPVPLPVATPPSRRRTSRRVVARRKEVAALVIPSLIPILVFSVAPLLNGVYLAFTDATLSRNSSNAFTGFGQFGKLLGDTLFLQSFKIGMIWAFSVTLLQLVAGLGLALLLNANLRLQGVTRLLALIPWAMPPVVVAIMWKMLYNPNSGPLNGVVRLFDPGFALDWLGSFGTALPAAIVVGVWVGMPQTSITLLAGLQQIPDELVEAAEMDGAGTWSRFAHVTLPALRPVITSITSLNFIWNFNSFGLVYVLTEGGPGGQTMLPMLFAYNEAFKYRDIAYAAAMGNVMVLVVVVLLMFYLWTQVRGERD